MQTFLPYSSFRESAKCLDKRRLSNQIKECQQILNALLNPEAKGWKNHPAVLMWRGSEDYLFYYATECYIVWHAQTFKSHLSYEKILMMEIPRDDKKPSWLGNQSFHDSHKSNLLRKDFEFYSQYGWNVPDNLEYVWPTKTL